MNADELWKFLKVNHSLVENKIDLYIGEVLWSTIFLVFMWHLFDYLKRYYLLKKFGRNE